MDLGGHRFFSKDKTINDLWLELLPEQGKVISEKLEPRQRDEYSGNADPNTSDEVMLIRRRISRIYYLNKFFDYPVSISWGTIRNMGFLRTVKCGFGYFGAILFKRKGDSLEDFYINRFGKPLYEMFFKYYTTKLWGVSPALLDSDWGAQRVKNLSLMKTIWEQVAKKFNKNHTTNETSLIEEFYYPKFGPGQLWEKMADEVKKMGGQLLLNTDCNQLIVENNKIVGVSITDSNGQKQTLDCDYVVSSMPVKELVNCINVAAPSDVKNISDNLPYRDFITVGVLVKNLNIKNKTEFKTYNDIIPDCWIYVQEKNVKMGRIQVFNNWSPFMPSKPENTVWMGLEYFCSEGDEMWTIDENAFIEMAISELEKMGITSREDVLDSTLHKVKKAYPAYYGSYKDFDKVKDYLNKFDNLYCIGRNGQHRYNNMDHSMMTGILAASAIQNGSTDKEYIWNVNTEQSYHEAEENNDK